MGWCGGDDDGSILQGQSEIMGHADREGQLKIGKKRQMTGIRQSGGGRRIKFPECDIMPFMGQEPGQCGAPGAGAQNRYAFFLCHERRFSVP